MSESLRRIEARARERIRQALEPEESKRARVLILWALGPKDTHDLLRWMKEGSMIEQLLKENMELRAKWINLEARLTVLADRIAARKLARVFKAAREVVDGEGED